MIRVPQKRLLSAAAAVGFAVAGLTVAAAPVASAAPCSDIDVPVARGTGEPGTLGLIVGDPVFSAVQNRLRPRSVSGYRVDYPADLGEPASVQRGNTDLVNHVRSQAAACPSQRFVLVGYSQGANVVDNSIGISSDGAIVGGPIVATIPRGPGAPDRGHRAVRQPDPRDRPFGDRHLPEPHQGLLRPRRPDLPVRRHEHPGPPQLRQPGR